MKLDEWGHRKNKKASRQRMPNTCPSLPDSAFSRARTAPKLRPATTASLTLRSQDDQVEPSVEPEESPPVPVISHGEERNLSPLHNAVVKRQPGTVRLILSAGASCENRDNFGDTPLHYAYIQANEDPDQPMVLEIVRLLLDQGADPLAQNEVGVTPLHRWATSARLLHLALPKCSNIDVQNKSRETPLHAAIKSSLITENPTAEAVLILVEAGAQIHLPNLKLETPLDLAVNPTYRSWYRTPSDITLFVERAAQTPSKAPWATLSVPFDRVLANPDIGALLWSEAGLGSWVKLIRSLISYGIEPNWSCFTGEGLLNLCFRRLGILYGTPDSPRTQLLIFEMRGLISELVRSA